MKKLNLPFIKNMRREKRVLSMDEYLEFVLFNLEHTTGIEAVREQKKKAAVNVPFKLR